MRKLFIITFSVALLVGALLACGESNASSNTGSSVATTSTTATIAPVATHFKVGQIVKVGSDFIVTINSVKTNTGNDISKPKGVFLIVDVTLKNVSAKEQDVSSVLSFGLKDSTGQKYNEAFMMATDGSTATAPDGKVEAGSLLRGQLVYDVPVSMHSYTFSFEADIISAGQTTWDIHI